MSSQDRIRREAIAQYGDAPTTPTEALAHTLAVLRDRPDSELVVMATSGVYGDGIRTGLTLGDLRAIAGRLTA